MGMQQCWGSGGSASVWLVVRGASVVRVAGIGSASVDRWWCVSHFGALAASNATTNHQQKRQKRVVVAEPQVDGRQHDN
jgi:L-aminopeptidase/D-esterase-like protein